MSYIILARSPRTKRLVIVTDDAEETSEDVVAEFPTQDEAEKAAGDVPICQAWGYEVVEVA